MDRRVIVVGGVALIAYNFMLKSTAAKNLKVGDIKYQRLAWKGLSGTLHLIMPVTNITRGTLRFDGFTGSILTKWKSNGKNYEKELLPCVIPTKVVIKARSTTMIPIEIDISAVSVGSQIWEMFKSKNWVKNAWVKGNILLGAIELPIDKKIY